MSLLELNTPLPLLPANDDIATPATPKRSRGASASLSRRVRANLNTLSIPDISNKNMAGGLHLQLQPEGRVTMGGASFESILLGGAMRNKASKAHLILNPSSSSSSLSPALPAPPKQQLQLHPRKQPTTMRRTGARASKPVMMMMHKGSPIKTKNDNVSLLSLRMAAMLKGSTDAKAQLKFGGSFQAPGRTRSSPYRPSRNIPIRNRSFNALCA